MIPTLCKVHSATFKALNTLQERDTLKYRSTDTFIILVMKPMFGSSVVAVAGMEQEGACHDPRSVPFFAGFFTPCLRGVLRVLRG